MSADTLRRAAKTLREHAMRTRSGPWNSSPVDSPDAIVTSAVYSFAHETGTPESEVIGVALALAKSLDDWAEIVDGVDKMLGHIPDDAYLAEFALARAILRENGGAS